MATDRHRRIDAEMLTCRHFNGAQHDRCKAGVNYRQLAGEPSFGCMTRIPCLPIHDPKGGLMAVCEQRNTYTQDEAESMVTQSDAAMERHMRAYRAVHDDAKAKGLKRGRGGRSALPCPICGGTLAYSVAAVNGHMHAACDTTQCVRWME